MNSRRLFAGVKVAATAEMHRTLADLQRELRGGRIRWTRPENLHLTVEFFGATDEARIPELAEALAQAAARMPAFELAWGKLGTFGGKRHPRVLWLGVESAGLAALHGRVETALREAGWMPEAREFAPHLTLGRMDRLKDAERFNAAVARGRGFAAPAQTVRELILYESAGGRYVPVERWKLGEG